MLDKKTESKTQVHFLSLEDLVPEDHLVRKLENAINLDFIYDEVKELYSDKGRPSIDPVVLIKLNIIQYTFGIRSMRQTIKEVEVNSAYRWYIGYDFYEKIPHFGTFSKNYNRRFKDTDIFEQIFFRIIEQITLKGLIDETNVFIDGTHIKANANNHRYKKAAVKQSVKYYEEELQKEIARDRELHEKRTKAT